MILRKLSYMSDTKKCPYCGEEIKIVATKCKHCGEWLDSREQEPIANTNNNPQSTSFITLHKKELLYGLMSLLGLVLIICGRERYLSMLDAVGVITYLGGWFLLSFGASMMALGLCKNPNIVKRGIVVSGLVICLVAIGASAYGLGEIIGGYLSTTTTLMVPDRIVDGWIQELKTMPFRIIINRQTSALATRRSNFCKKSTEKFGQFKKTP